MVVIDLPTTSEICVEQLKIGLPSSSTVHAPHAPSPQPYLVPVSCNSSRRISSSVRSGGDSIVFFCLLMVKLTDAVSESIRGSLNCDGHEDNAKTRRPRTS